LEPGYACCATTRAEQPTERIIGEHRVAPGAGHPHKAVLNVIGIGRGAVIRQIAIAVIAKRYTTRLRVLVQTVARVGAGEALRNPRPCIKIIAVGIYFM
jgi:hypothetical protein